MKPVELKRKPNQDVIDAIKRTLEQAERGEITEISIVTAFVDKHGPSFSRYADFENAWVLLGALEYAKSSVFKAIDETAHEM